MESAWQNVQPDAFQYVQLLKYICQQLGIEVEDVAGKRRYSWAVLIRGTISYVLYVECGWSMKTLATFMDRERTGLTYVIEQVADMIIMGTEEEKRAIHLTRKIAINYLTTLQRSE